MAHERAGRARTAGAPIAGTAGVLLAAWVFTKLGRRRHKPSGVHGTDKPVIVSLKVSRRQHVQLCLKVR
jgi:hypothetical protein